LVYELLFVQISGTLTKSN